MAEQSFTNHAKIVPMFHYVLLPILGINLVSSLVSFYYHGLHWSGVLSFLMAVAFIILAFEARLFALRVQDRLIRLEERLRCERLLPADLKPRIGEFTPRQLIAMRFASDEELPELARKVVAENLTELKPIKQSIRSWRSDHLRV